MSIPPPGGWPPPQQPGQPPSPGQPYSQPYDPSGYNPQQSAPPSWQQGAWAPPAAPPPQKGNSLKWLLVGIAVLLVIGISVGATLLFTRDGNGGGGTTPTSGAPSDVASANDTGPVAIITDEPTCDAFNGINNSLADVEAKGWGDQRAVLGPVSGWTPTQRSLVQEVATAMRNAAAQALPLARQTPHRVMRELYEQFAAYGQAYADSASTYTQADDGLASANVNAGSSIIGICNAISYGSATRSITMQPAQAPTSIAPAASLNDPKPFISSSDEPCTAWKQSTDQFNAGTSEWQQLDTSTPASQWTPERASIEKAAVPYLSAWANDMQATGRRSANPTFEDFALTAALYTEAFLSVGADYTGADSWLSYTAYRLNNVVSGACLAAAG